MAQICNTCLTTTPRTKSGMCPTCAHTNDRTRRPTGWQRYPPQYRHNRTAILNTNPPCHWCGQPATTADHLQPRAQGGNHTIANLVPSCGPCNSSRGGRQRNTNTP